MRQPGSADDPLWYKDAIIYELSVKGFFDRNNDGVGDLPGLVQKLDYLQDLGVTCLWLLPFFPSPQRDDGYDIADYYSIHQSYGTMDDFRALLDAAHERGMQVMIELVINHTSDQHPWFQAARRAPPGSAEREFYVWSDTDRKFPEARIIFTDTEKSNWTWDPVAQAYFWHRFFSHQPDLNYDNPRVIEEVVSVMCFWLEMGVDALRLDAIPYLVEREGTNCENLDETHRVIRQVRAAMDERFLNRMILAEANQWPTDVCSYFGAGDECHMAFHFPVMPRLFMSLRLEDRHPITEIMGQTPPIHESCQWGLFLRNHDELTLEMVTDEERDYMYFAYSADGQMRLNVGIRRRLAPLVDNNRRRVELLHSILFSFPGTPILYYGDEIGMGDNVYLGDRNGVRTPMQWSGDRNAGFSRANPAKLYSPVIIDPVYGYEAINVEAQRSDPSSLMNWMRNMIALRKLFKVFGRGTIEFLYPSNRKVLAYIRCYEDETILCIANLSRFAQPAELDLARFVGMVPMEMLGYVEFPPIRKSPYSITLGPYGYLWFELQKVGPIETEPVDRPEGREELQASGWEAMFHGTSGALLEREILPKFLARQRWFGAKTRTIESVAIRDWAVADDSDAVLALADVHYREGGLETYFIPLCFSPGAEAAKIQEANPECVLAPLCLSGVTGFLCDATVDGRFSSWLLSLIANGRRCASQGALIWGRPGEHLGEICGFDSEDLTPVRGSAEQSNTSIRYGRHLILKLFRRLDNGPNPDCEIGSYLSERMGFVAVPRFGGLLGYQAAGGKEATLGMLQEMVPNQGDGWEWTLDELSRYYEGCLNKSAPPPAATAGMGSISLLSLESPTDASWGGMSIHLDLTATLARRTAEMHLALASETGEEAMSPEPFCSPDLTRLAADLRGHAVQVFETLKNNLSRLPDEIVETAGLVLSRRRWMLDRFNGLEGMDLHLIKTRIHGDYHLGQVLRVQNDYRILDFEGEPARPLAERRARQSPLKDVAGMMRSYSYAAWAGFLGYTSRHPQDAAPLEPWASLWERATCSRFLSTYRETIAGSPIAPADPKHFARILDAFVLDKALYELSYELNNRPSWVRIPLIGILALC